MAKKAREEVAWRERRPDGDRNTDQRDDDRAQIRSGEQSVRHSDNEQNGGNGGKKLREGAKWTDIALLACAGAAIIVSYWQWGVGRDQLEFAVNSAVGNDKDTHAALSASTRIASASEKEAANAAGSADAAWRSADAASKQSAEIAQQTAIAIDQVKTALEANKLAINRSQIDQRAWVKAEAEIAGPLTLEKYDWRIPINFEYRM